MPENAMQALYATCGVGRPATEVHARPFSCGGYAYDLGDRGPAIACARLLAVFVRRYGKAGPLVLVLHADPADRFIMLHGRYDPHPGSMTRDSLLRYLPQLQYHEWARCGHSPWIEKSACEAFFSVMCEWLTRRTS